MVPVRLELKNFLSYGEDAQVLDLTGMHTICLSGENGNGKSALLDAITWSLWGESRAGKNKHDELVRIGSDEMSVTFTFEMDDERYRVLRKRSKRAGGNQWELQQTTGGDGWRSLTGNNAGETEKAIQRLLRMSYDTFLNSAYLRQGRADQFVQQTPGKRKEILAEILDLSRYDRLEAMAREKKRDADIDGVDVERQLNQIEAELCREDGYKAERDRLNAEQERLASGRQELVQKRDDARVRLGMLQGRKALVDPWARQHRRRLSGAERGAGAGA
jgi:exonuclease SbcC